MKVQSVAHEGGVVDEVEAGPVLRDFTVAEQLLSQLNVRTRKKHPGVPETVDHVDDAAVELLESLTADVKGMLEKRRNEEKLTKIKKSS